MNMVLKSFSLLLAIMFMILPAYPLSLQDKQFAIAQTVAAPGDVVTQWFDIRNFTKIDFTILATAGSGTIVVQYATDSAKASIIDDSVSIAFATGASASLFGANITKFYARLKLSCVVAPCTFDGWFAAKGQVR